MKAFVFDTETTGLIDNRLIPLNKQPEVIEFYGCSIDLETGEIDQEIDSLIKPSLGPISSEITKITGITSDDVTSSPPFSHIATAIFNSISEAKAVIAHNLSFDMEILEMEFLRLNMTVPWPSRQICTIEQTMHYRGYRLSLMGLHEMLFGEPFEEAHRARNDVAALIRCARTLFQRGDI